MFHLIFAIPGLYVSGRSVWPVPWAPGVKLAVVLLILFASQYHLYSRWSSGSVFSAEMPRAAIIAFNWAFSAILLLALLQILFDLAGLARMLVTSTSHGFAAPLRYAMMAAAMVVSAVGVHAAIRVPPPKDVEVEIANLPAQFEGYTLLQLTDLHISRLFPEAWTTAIVKAANALNADLVVVTGDLIDGSVADRARDVAPLQGLRARDGIFVIPGNHEYFFDPSAWMQQFARLGMTPLENSHVIISRQGAQLVLAGVTDLSAEETGLPMPDLGKALAGAPSAAPVIMLDHQPKNAGSAAARGVALQLSGHTHGGLVVGLDRIFAWANGGYVSGLYTVQDMTLYVSNGTALWGGLALRLGKPPELTRITLRRRAGGKPA